MSSDRVKKIPSKNPPKNQTKSPSSIGLTAVRTLITRLIIASFAIYLIINWSLPAIRYGQEASTHSANSNSNEVQAGYFYDEDEAHHFHRLLRMVQDNDLNPHYFLKPSGHFYLRMPALMLGFLSEVKSGKVRKVQDLGAHSPYGIGGYPLHSEHWRVVKTVRAFSILVILLGSLGLFVEAHLAGWISFWGILVALVALFGSGALGTEGAKVGVDNIGLGLGAVSVMYAMAAVRTGSSKKAYRESRLYLWLAVIFAGITCGVKYNLAIAFLAPLGAIWLRGQGRDETSEDEPVAEEGRYQEVLPRVTDTLFAFLLFICAFLLTSPYIFAELALFFNNVAYEAWHYGSGDINAQGKPGLSQAWHYLGHFAKSFGYIFIAFAVISGLDLVKSVLLARTDLEKNRRAIFLVFAIFPAMYFAFMCSQVVNYTRNMLILYPFIALLGVMMIEKILLWLLNARKSVARVSKRLIANGLIILTVGGATLELLYCGYTLRKSFVAEDTRADAFGGLTRKTAIDFRLQPPLKYKAQVVREDSLFTIYNHGFDELLAPAIFPRPAPVLDEYEGNVEMQRVAKSPYVMKYDLQDLFLGRNDELNNLPLSYRISCDGQFVPSCTDNCWINKRHSKILITNFRDNKYRNIRLKFHSPWKEQEIKILGRKVQDNNAVVSIPKTGIVPIVASVIDTPLAHGSPDDRRLGFYITSVECF